jgi:hypothetical protein
MSQQLTPEDRFRRAAELEDGCPVSAGARVAHVQLTWEDGRGVQVDLVGIPNEKRPGVVAAIQAMVNQARGDDERGALPEHSGS